MMNEFFQALCVPDRWNVAGVSVRPLTCWHLYALEQSGNAYAFDGSGATRDDAAGLLLVCQHDYASGSRLMTQPRRMIREAKRMARKLRNVPAGELDTACRDYADTCKELPEVWTPEGKGGGKSLGGNHVWHVVVALMQLGFSEAESWNMPYTKARCYYAILRESQGGCEIMSDRSRALLEQARQVMEAKT